MNTVTLCDGREVPSDSPEWRDECLARYRHVQNLRGRSIDVRRMYLRGLQAKEGAEMALRVSEDYAADWKKRKDEMSNNTQRKDGSHD